jgi:hypothetical protein
VVHEKAVNGLAIAEATELEVNICTEYLLGPEGLDNDNKWMLTEDINTRCSNTGHCGNIIRVL